MNPGALNAHRFRAVRALVALLVLGVLSLSPSSAFAQQPIYVTFLWHMHQPRYWPGEDVVTTSRAGHFSFDPLTVHRDRTGPYTTWPRDAISAARAAGLGACGAQVSFTGSLMENLDAMRDAGAGFADWVNPWREARAWTTDAMNPRLDMVDFGFFHPLMPLNAARDNELQVLLFRELRDAHFGGRPSRGIFTPENAFHPRLIPTLAGIGVQWVLVDNVHFDRTRIDLPYAAGSNLYPPNGADRRTPMQPGSWVQLNDIWAPSRVSAPWGYQPHRVAWVDPATGRVSSIIAVPAARYEGNEDARGGFGALQYERVLSQYAAQNTDARHPMLVVLHHDGDNYGGGSESYYHSNFQAFAAWMAANPTRFVCTTIQDYLDRFPPEAADVIHVEPGSWAGADNGDPEFLKWNADPDARSGVSPDRSSWASVVAARKWVHTAERQHPIDSLANVRANRGSGTERAWRAMLESEASDYWYWDGSEGGTWDSLPTRACNTAVAAAREVVDMSHDDVGPSVHPPQRDPYNPGAIEWGTTVQPTTFTVWTLAYDLSGLSRVTLRWRLDPDGRIDVADEMHANAWTDVAMTGADVPVPMGVPTATARARQWSATISSVTHGLVHYMVEAVDMRGNVSRSDVSHVWVGPGNATGPDGGIPIPDAGPVDAPVIDVPVADVPPVDVVTTDAAVDATSDVVTDIGPVVEGSYSPMSPTLCDRITVRSRRGGMLHWGINNWMLPPASVRPTGSAVWSDMRAVETPFTMISTERYEATIGPFDGASPAISTIEYVIHYAGDQWSSPDTRITLTPCVVDAGAVDASVSDVVASDATVSDVVASDVVVKDVGVIDEVPTAAPVSDCGCHSVPTTRAPWGALAVLAAMVARRRVARSR